MGLEPIYDLKHYLAESQDFCLLYWLQRLILNCTFIKQFNVAVHSKTDKYVLSHSSDKLNIVS
jgi:hypothetical protein